MDKGWGVCGWEIGVIGRRYDMEQQKMLGGG